jgi:hypothetical protein
MGVSTEAAFKQMRTMTVPMQLPQPPRHVKRQRTQPPNVELSSSANTMGSKQHNMLTISMNPEGHTSAKPTKVVAAPLPANTKTIQVVDMKETRHAILANWRAFTAAEVVRLHKIHYTNLRSAAVMLSRLKQELGSLEDPPGEEYLSKLALSKAQYNEIRKMNSESRKRGAMDVVTISNGDSIVLQAMRYITSSDPNLLIAALFPLTGMRPIEIAKMALFQTKLNNKQEHQSFWACQTRFAKRERREQIQ